MTKYYDNIWNDPMLWSVIIGITAAFLVGLATQFYEGIPIKDRDAYWYVAWAIWIGVFITYGFSTYQGYRRIQYRSCVLHNKNAETDANRFITVYIINIVLVVGFFIVYMYDDRSLGAAILLVLLLIAIGYQAGLTSKWGCKNKAKIYTHPHNYTVSNCAETEACGCRGESCDRCTSNSGSSSSCCSNSQCSDCCCRRCMGECAEGFGTGEGVTWMLLPYFVWSGILLWVVIFGKKNYLGMCPEKKHSSSIDIKYSDDMYNLSIE